MRPTYDAAVRDAVRQRMRPPKRESITEIARATGMAVQTLVARQFGVRRTRSRWVAAVSLSGPFHAFNFNKYARRYRGGFCFRFNPRFAMAAMTERIAHVVCCWQSCAAASRGRR